MITVRIKIGTGAVRDTYETYGMIYVESDTRFEADLNDFATTTYAEQSGENMDPRTTRKAFDYKIKFLIETPNSDIENANAKIRAFNSLLYTKASDSDVLTFKTVTLYNDYKRVKIVGTPKDFIKEATDFWRDDNKVAYDCVQAELTIHVSNPELCDFSI
jgi:hypothetical protein